MKVYDHEDVHGVHKRKWLDQDGNLHTNYCQDIKSIVKSCDEIRERGVSQELGDKIGLDSVHVARIPLTVLYGLMESHNMTQDEAVHTVLTHPGYAHFRTGGQTDKIYLGAKT